MSDKTDTFRTKISGWWSPRHSILNGEGQLLGVLTIERNWRGMIVGGEYQPEKGERLLMRREPGLQRAQFSLWTAEREWLGSSIRPHPFQRRIDVWTGVRPYRVVPKLTLGRGWRVVASKTGEVASIDQPLVPRGSTWHSQPKIDFELLLFCYFLGSLAPMESLLPTSIDAPNRSDNPKTAHQGS
ncbi:MAG: hypothetical protein H6830_11190 [Planctomycetes bacterium]|nr:hypothetical protein [Planctomycetota bacterium]MCB9908769.1 hypothetical protein [Planctomycetota bacterium]MCB9912406.1 hypothetical protein [Planctomycetota bacterium]HPF15091.1 hypothetical protein [Planctomycetota bacterium]